MKILSVNNTGRSHTYDNKPCDDAVYISEQKDVICVCDGVSNAPFGGIGAHHLAFRVGERISKLRDKHFFETESVERIRICICEMINDVLNELCNKYNTGNKEDFASTFLALIKTDNHICILHAGDGAVFGNANTSQEIGVTLISGPDNSPDGRVYSAGYPDQRSRMRVLRLNPSDYKAIMLCTDGFSDPYLDFSYQSFDTVQLAEAFKLNDNDALQHYVSNYHIRQANVSDDISCVIYKINDNKAPTPSTCKYSDVGNNAVKSKDSSALKTEDKKVPEFKKEPAPHSSSIPINKSKAGKLTVNISKAVIAIIIAVAALAAGITGTAIAGERIKALSAVNQAQEEEISAISEICKDLSARLSKLEENDKESNDSGKSSSKADTDNKSSSNTDDDSEGIENTP